jgi:hypothetical protein
MHITLNSEMHFGSGDLTVGLLAKDFATRKLRIGEVIQSALLFRFIPLPLFANQNAKELI